MTRQSKLLRWSIFYALIFAVAPPAFAQWNEQVLYSFQGLPDGAVPVGSIVFDKQGNLYGATTDGGSSVCDGAAQCGTVFQLAPPPNNGDSWRETVLYVFKGRGAGDGGTPAGGVIIDAAGNLYGTTAYNGTGTCLLLGSIVGCGIAYELSPPAQPGGAWTENVLYNFQGGNDGYLPRGDLLFDKTGNLFGVTEFGGGKGTNCGDSLYPNCGTIFELSPPKIKGGAWTEKVLYSFGGLGPWSIASDGAEPNGGLMFDETGSIYGTTAYGGSDAGICQSSGGCGTAFELIPPGPNSAVWIESVLHRFLAQPNDGARPNGNLLLAGGALYGTAVGGGTHEEGVVFALRPLGKNGVWEEDLIYIFTGGSDGAGPTSLILGPDGSFLGAAGSRSGGLIFQLQPPIQKGGTWTLVPEYDFTGPPNGRDPTELMLVKGQRAMYGTTIYGGTGQACNGGCGTVFEVSP